MSYSSTESPFGGTVLPKELVATTGHKYYGQIPNAIPTVAGKEAELEAEKSRLIL